MATTKTSSKKARPTRSRSAPAKKSATRKRSAAGKTSTTGHASLDALNSSLETAQGALSELSGNLSRGGRDLVKDLQKRVNEASRDARKMNRSLVDL
jgi:hypothetical protein